LYPAVAKVTAVKGYTILLAIPLPYTQAAALYWNAVAESGKKLIAAPYL
jgi:hypothetical protein